MDKKILSLFATAPGKDIYSVAVSSIEEYGMEKMIKKGVLVGLSGGADSVMLLCFLIEYRRRTADFPILAVHINHSIRGESADRDEAFAKRMCASLGVEFISEKIDVPSIAKENGLGIEECARNVRYQEFQNIIQGRNDIGSISVAHNADDNLETVIFNIFRGTGLR
ncbi:MAG: tRNA lysidine(34) synthetase TilS, partial [Clostridia bacterium]|nr:tRNA lysidine(34) synthetase TilS [Clostridia bacterium]